MNKFPFTPTGVAEMCKHFYAMNDEALYAAARELGGDLTSWFKNTFILTERQIIYFDNINPQVQRFMAANGEFALANRLPIILLKEGEPEPEPVDSKVANPKPKLAARILPNGQFTPTGEFVIEITY